MKRKIILTFLTAIMLLTGCSGQEVSKTNKRYEASFLTLFDTVTTMIGYGETEEAFSATAQQIHDELLEYHQLFDVYNDYPGINNLKTINDQAGIKPVKVDQRLIDLLLFCREVYDRTDGRVSAAMGSVLYLWHMARTDGLEDSEHAELPDMGQLQEAARHMDFDHVIIDTEASTIYLEDPDMRLDVGALAKGYAVEQVCRNAPAGILISVGGNVCATGPKPEGGGSWVVGVQDPDEANGTYLHTLSITDGSVVTSGDYQRYYTVDGVRYHHIIDPETLMPADKWRCVTVICPDSGVADALSTALFLMSREEGQELLDMYDAEAMWVDYEGNELYSPGFEDYIRT